MADLGDFLRGFNPALQHGIDRNSQIKQDTLKRQEDRSDYLNQLALQLQSKKDYATFEDELSRTRNDEITNNIFSTMNQQPVQQVTQPSVGQSPLTPQAPPKPKYNPIVQSQLDKAQAVINENENRLEALNAAQAEALKTANAPASKAALPLLAAKIKLVEKNIERSRQTIDKINTRQEDREYQASIKRQDEIKELKKSGVVLPPDATQEQIDQAWSSMPSETEQKMALDSGKRQVEAKERFGRTSGILKQFTAQLRGLHEDQGGGGLVKGMKGQLLAAKGKIMDTPDGARVEAFKGQRIETALSLVGIVTGQNRMIEGVLNKLLETLPTGYESEAQAEQKLRQSIQNAYRLTKAYEKFGIDLSSRKSSKIDNVDGKDVEFVSLTDAEQKMINSQLNNPMTEQEKADMESVVNEIISTPATPKATGTFGATEDISSLSDEELQRIAYGG